VKGTLESDLASETVSHYRIEKKLGAGGMGDVYLAEDTRLNRKVAIKFLSPELVNDEQARKRLVREARTAAKLDHPNICGIYEVAEEGERSFIVMQYVEGETLAARMQDNALRQLDYLPVAVQVADALAEAHSRGVVHRDIKPQNIMITRRKQVKVLDFGLAKVAREGETISSIAETDLILTAPGLIVGTIPYMSPEQIKGERLDRRSDIFSFGAVLYEMVTGRGPFTGESTAGILSSVLTQEPAPLARYAADVPDELQRIVSKCLEKDRDRRYQSARELTIDLGALKKIAESTANTSAKPAIRQRSDSRKLVIAVAAGLILAIAAFWIYMSAGRKGANPTGRLTLAVLPFYGVNTPEELRYLSIGIPDAIITRLANVRSIGLRPTSAILRYENLNVDPQEAGRALQTDYVLSGTLQKAGEQFSVRVQLVHVSDGTSLWGKQYEVARPDLLKLQDSLAERISESLRIQMTADESEKFYRRYTDNAAAYESYLQGRYYLARYTSDGTIAAVSAFEKALALDSNYALAHAGTAMASAQMSIRFASETDVAKWSERAKQEATSALELDPGLAEAHEALAAVYRNTEFDWARTIEQSGRALELRPTLEMPHYYRATAFYHLGLFDLIEHEVQAGLEINPVNRVEPLRVRGSAALFGGEYAEAITVLEEAKRLSDHQVNDWYLAQAYYYSGDAARAESLLSNLRGSAQAERRAQATLAGLLAARGQRNPAKALINNVLTGTYMDHHVAYALGAAYAQLGDSSEALKWLERAANTGLPCYPWYERDQLLQPLRDDQKFRNFMARLRSSWEEARVKHAG
jgi:serine/threonine-protein kinase